MDFGGGDGAEVIYALRNNDKLAKQIADNIESKGQNVRKYYQRRLPSNPSKDYYYVLRDTPNIQSLIVEYGFLDSTGDDVNQIKNNYEDYAEAVVQALSNYAGKKYVSNSTSNNTYIVKKGDTLWNIAKKNNTSVDEIKKLNNISSNALSIGQTLYLPVGNSTNTYVVKKGDTLYQIAKNNNTTVEEIKRINNISSNNLSIGQKLKLPSSSTTYVVVKGDTLYQIAKDNKTSVSDIINANNLKSSNLSIGQKLIIP